MKEQDVMLVMALLAEQCGVKMKLDTQALVPNSRGVLGMAGSWNGETEGLGKAPVLGWVGPDKAAGLGNHPGSVGSLGYLPGKGRAR